MHGGDARGRMRRRVCERPASRPRRPLRCGGCPSRPADSRGSPGAGHGLRCNVQWMHPRSNRCVDEAEASQQSRRITRGGLRGGEAACLWRRLQKLLGQACADAVMHLEGAHFDPGGGSMSDRACLLHSERERERERQRERVRERQREMSHSARQVGHGQDACTTARSAAAGARRSWGGRPPRGPAAAARALRTSLINGQRSHPRASAKNFLSNGQG